MSDSLSASMRSENLRRMRDEPFEVLVVGGGIVGAGVARDAACRGLATALVERGDFACGTSGKTSRLIHGGLRYLRKYKVGLVRQAVRERDVLLERAPTLVHPLPFVIPAYRDRGPGRRVLRLGLSLYDFLSRSKAIPRHSWLRPKEVSEREPGLSQQELAGAGIYYDAWTEDARLVLAVVRDAARAGAVVANHTEVTRLLRTNGEVDGATLTDQQTQGTLTVRARVVVNATGVALDRLRAPQHLPTIRPTKGTHIFLRRAKIGNRHALAFTARRDGRVVFVLPWGDLSLVGTTDTDFHGHAEAVLPDAKDVEYLLDAVNDAFPGAQVESSDVISAYAGLRPLVRRGGDEGSESDVSRAHSIFEDADGLISVAGGKLTTHRVMAHDVVELVSARLNRRSPCRTGDLPLGPPLHALEEYTRLGFDDPSAIHLRSRVSPEELARYLDVPGARERIVADLPYVWAEVDIAVREEMAMTLEDVLVRRLGLFYEAADQAVGSAPAVADRIGRLLGWDAARETKEVEAYRELVRAHRRFRDLGV